MRNLLLSACSAALLAGSNLAKADDTNEAYYSGQFTCSGREYATDWNVTRQLGAEGVAAIVYYQRSGSDHVQWLELGERAEANGNGLYDANGNLRLDVAADGETIRATWRKGAPDIECSPFTVSRSESPRNRFDNLFGLMETPEPTEDVAEKVAAMTTSAPIIYALPELDQQTYHRRYGELKKAFWTNYRDGVAKRLTQSPVATAEERQAFGKRLDEALSGPLHFALDDAGFKTVLAAVHETVDRYAAAGGHPAEELYAGNHVVCQRLTAISDANPGFDFGKLELAAGVPSDYWTRDLAEDLLKGLRGCDVQAAQSYAHSLPSAWPKIQEKQQLALSFRQEQARLLALPVTMATLVETKNLQPDAQIARTVSKSSDIYQRFFGPSLDTRRGELVEVSLASITEWAASYSIDKPALAKSVTDACEALDDSGLPRETREVVRQTCDDANTTIAGKQSAQAIEQIKAAFASAEPRTDAAKAAVALCETMPSTLSYDAQREVYQFCSRETDELRRKEAELLCAQAIEASDASSELLESTIEVRNPIGDRNVAIKDLICRVAENEIKVSFSSSGFLMWKTQGMNLHFERADGKERTLRLVLNPSESGADWTVGVEDEDTKAELARQRLTEDVIMTCLMDRC